MARTYRMGRHAVETVVAWWPGTRGLASDDHSTCYEIATSVHDPERCEPLVDRPRSSTEPGYGLSLEAVHGTLDGGTMVSKKNFRRVTTLRRKLGVLGRLRRSLDPLTAHSFGRGVRGFGGGITASSGLALCRLPAANLTLAFRILTVPLVPATRPIPGSATLTQTGTHARSTRSRTAGTRSGTVGTVEVILGRVHGSATSERIVRGERVTVLPGRLSKPRNRPASSLFSRESTRQKKTRQKRDRNRRAKKKERDERERNKEHDDFRNEGGKETKKTASNWPSTDDQNWPPFYDRSHLR